MRLNHVYILIGSNIEPQRNVLRALEMLKHWFNVTAVSPIYESVAVGGDADAAPYWNMAVQIETYTILMLLRRKLRTIEHQLGRQRFDLEGERLKEVTVDLDILLYNNEVNRSVLEPLPHPDLLQRAYASVPLADLAPGLTHPVTGEPIQEIAARLREGAQIRRLFPTLRVDIEAPAALPEGESRLEVAVNPEPVRDAVLPRDIPQVTDTLSPTPSLESLITLPEVGSDVQPTMPSVEMSAPVPEKKRKGKKTPDPESIPAKPTKAKPSRSKKQV
jgi:2-amino-4-hydroxy-6-hydroxymethyldihydropteridine diphosphokinase